MFNVIIWADKKFDNPELLKSKCDHLLSRKDKSEVTIITANENLEVESYASNPEFGGHRVMKADWDNKGKRAGYFRNLNMTELGNALIVFLGADYEDKGAENLIRIARERHLLIRIIKEEDNY